MRYTFMSDGYAAVKNDVCYEDSEWDYCGDAIDKLAAYEDAEEQGRLVILPYSVGDLFWAIAYSEPRVIHVRLYQITVHYKEGYILWVENIDEETDWWKLPIREFEKWCHFPTYEEAEAVLKGEKKDV